MRPTRLPVAFHPLSFERREVPIRRLSPPPGPARRFPDWRRWLWKRVGVDNYPGAVVLCGA